MKYSYFYVKCHIRGQQITKKCYLNGPHLQKAELNTWQVKLLLVFEVPQKNIQI